MSGIVRSMELWAASKIIGRECATVNKNFAICKSEGNPNRPKPCEAEGELVHSCTVEVVEKVRNNFPKEFEAFQQCLDYSDYRIHECRETERALLNCWNNKFIFKVEEPVVISDSTSH